MYQDTRRCIMRLSSFSDKSLSAESTGVNATCSHHAAKPVSGTSSRVLAEPGDEGVKGECLREGRARARAGARARARARASTRTGTRARTITSDITTVVRLRASVGARSIHARRRRGLRGGATTASWRG